MLSGGVVEGLGPGEATVSCPYRLWLTSARKTCGTEMGCGDVFLMRLCDRVEENRKGGGGYWEGEEEGRGVQASAAASRLSQRSSV